MLQNYLNAALRSILKQRVYSAINVFGLAVGIAGALAIALYVQYEFSYDQTVPDKERIFKLALERKYPNHSTYYAIVPHSFSEVMQRDLPEVEETTRLSGAANNILVSYKAPDGTLKALEQNFALAADSNFFSFFKIPFIRGEAAGALTTANNIVITESVAKQFFGTDDPMGQSLEVFGNSFKVSGVTADPPENSHMRYGLVTSVAALGFYKQQNFTGFSAHLYVKLREASQAGAVTSKMTQLVDKYAAAQIERNLGKSWADYRKEGNGYRYFLQPLVDIHLDPTHMEAKMEAGGSRQMMYFLLSIAGLLILIACINFMNLATARSAERAREVGVRKTMGSEKRQLIIQFLSESVLLTVVAAVLALVLLQMMLPYFNQLTERNLQLTLHPLTMAVLVGGTLLIGLLAGGYPAFVLSSFSPAQVLKGKFISSKKGTWLRSGLVIFQFSISLILIVATFVVQRQMAYVQQKSLGFDQAQTLVVERAFAIPQASVSTFLTEVRRLPDVKAAAYSNALPGSEQDFFGNFFKPEGSTEILTTKTMLVADDLAETMGMDLLTGRWFAENTNDSLHVILNETAVKTMGINQPIGKKLENVQENQKGERVTVAYTIIGVVKDFHFMSLKDAITPLVLQSNEAFGPQTQPGYLLARVAPGKYAEAIASVEAIWKQTAPGQPFRYTFLDEHFNANYKSERQTGILIATFAGLAVMVACVGLFGLSAYTAQLRTKEIGVRKVMGASLWSVVLLLTRDFTKMVAIAIAIAAPLAWYLMSEWLGGFAYHTELSPMVFVMAGMVTLLIAWATVSFQTIRAGVMNPVRSLRSE